MEVLLNILQAIVLFGALWLGIRLGGIGIGLAAGLGVVLLGLLGLNTDYLNNVPFSVIAIIMAVIAAIAVMQCAGGMDFLVNWADGMLRKHPKHLVIWAPIIAFFMTVLAGTGNTAFSTLPVVTEVAKENNMKPTRALAMTVVASQVGICASPVSAAVVWMTSAASFHNADTGELLGTAPISYLSLLLIMIPACLAAIVIVALILNALPEQPLDQSPEYQRRLAEGTVKMRHTSDEMNESQALRPGAATSVWIFLGTIAAVMAFATLISPTVNILHTGLGRSGAEGSYSWGATDGIIALMLTAAVIIMMVCHVRPADVIEAPVFKAGMNSVICVLGVAWLGTTYVNGHMDVIKRYAGNLLNNHAWLFVIIVFVAAALLYSQASTAKAIMPIAFALGMAPRSILMAFPAVSALFILPTYPTLVAAVQMDDTGSTRLGNYVFNHPFFLPGTATIALAAVFAFLMSTLVLR